MRIPRIYTAQDLPIGREILLPEQAGEHAVRVLRLERGHPLILINGDGREYDAELASLAKRAVTAIVKTSREVKLDDERAERRMAHWISVIESACEQCGRTSLPTLGPPQRIDKWLASMEGNDVRCALIPDGETSLKDLPAIQEGIVVVVGPEGGLSDQDVAMLRQAQFIGLRLGPRILRTETAGVTALSALQALFGDLG